MSRPCVLQDKAPSLPAMLFRRCGNVSDMVRACTLVQSWSEGRTTTVSKVVLGWLHPGQTVTSCKTCSRLYLAVQRYFLEWVSSKLEGPPLARQYNVSTLEGDRITEAELRNITKWICDHLGERLPSEDEDLPPAA